MSIPDHIKRIIERIDPADREALEQNLAATANEVRDLRAYQHQRDLEIGEYRQRLSERSNTAAELSQECEKLRQERDALASHLRPIGDCLITQSGRMTADPLFCVFEKREVVADEAYDHDYISWTDAENDHQEIDGEKRERLEALHEGCRSIPERYQRCAIKEIDSFVTACFTERGCKDFLAIQGHNLRKPFTYVTSLFRNEEMKALRTMMMGLAIPAELPASPVKWNNEARRMASIMYPHMKKELTND